jgi:HlyD family secretion protein
MNRAVIKWIVYLALCLVVAGSALAVWLWLHQPQLPDYILSGNGRVEGNEVLIATKFTGRIDALLVDEGDRVTKGQVVARMDARAMRAELTAAQAREYQLLSEIKVTEAEVSRCVSDLRFQRSELHRFQQLAEKDYASRELLERYKMQMESSQACLASANAQKNVAQAQLKVAQANTRELSVNLGDMTITAPRNGRILYKVAEEGEVLSAGDGLLLLVDLDDLYMTIYLPERSVGKVKLDSDARIQVDALEGRYFSSVVTYIADEAEFTPKEVQTVEERQKLVFRIKLQVINNEERLLKPGMPGEGYVKLTASEPWPAEMQ